VEIHIGFEANNLTIHIVTEVNNRLSTNNIKTLRIKCWYRKTLFSR